MSDPQFVIWSEEHGRWWKPAGRGYTDYLAEAGRYSQQAAEQIVRNANFGTAINEIAFPVPGGPGCADPEFKERNER